MLSNAVPLKLKLTVRKTYYLVDLDTLEVDDIDDEITVSQVERGNRFFESQGMPYRWLCKEDFRENPE